MQLLGLAPVHRSTTVVRSVARTGGGWARCTREGVVGYIHRGGMATMVPGCYIRVSLPPTIPGEALFAS